MNSQSEAASVYSARRYMQLSAGAPNREIEMAARVFIELPTQVKLDPPETL